MTLIDSHHVGFTVSDMDRSVEWYRRFLGAEPVLRDVWEVPYIGEMVGYPGCKMECAYLPLPGAIMLELVRYIDPPPGVVDMETYNVGNGHLCIVVEDIHAEFARLAEIAELRSPAPVEIPWGPNAGGWGGYLQDPDGITIQLLQPARPA
jgi:catechol 2,3-dioxygenase-like lactoylglutathione lyase family enzyme